MYSFQLYISIMQMVEKNSKWNWMYHFHAKTLLGSFTFCGQSSLIYFKLSQVLHRIHDLGFSNLLYNKLNDVHKRFGTKITLMHWREISKKDLASLLSNPIIELSITTLKICSNPFSSTWTFCAHWMNLWMKTSFPF